MKKKIIIFCFVIVQITIIVFLVRNIFIHSNVLGTNISFSPILEDTVDFPKDSSLKYFYESKPNIILDKKPSWLKDGYKSTINDDGLNERFNYSVEKDPNIFRIVTIGDSFTFGAYVNTKDNYPEQIEAILNRELTCNDYKKFEVINLGLGGYDLEYAKERFARRGLKYNPDLVMWFLKGANFSRINEVIKPKQKKYRKEIEENGTLAQYEEQGIFYPHTEIALEEFYQEWTSEEILNYQKTALDSFTTEYKGKLLIFSFSFLEKEYKKEVEEFVKSRGNTYFYDGIPNIYSLGETLPDGHPNVKAYSLIAESLFSYLVQNEIILCN